MSSPSDMASAFERAGEIFHQLHAKDPLPTSEGEQQADFALSGMRRAVNDLILSRVSMALLESALLYQCIRFTTWNNNLGEDFFEYWSRRMDLMLERLVPFLKGLAGELPKDEPTLAMKELGQNLDQVRSTLTPGFMKPQLTRPELEEQADKTNRTLFQFVRDACDAGVSSGILESVFFYYWLRTSTLRDPAASEEFFQKFERHWEIVIERVGRLRRNWTRACLRINLRCRDWLLTAHSWASFSQPIPRALPWEWLRRERDDVDAWPCASTKPFRGTYWIAVLISATVCWEHQLMK